MKRSNNGYTVTSPSVAKNDPLIDALKATAQDDLGQRDTAIAEGFAQIGHRIRDGKGLQGGAAVEHASFQSLQAIIEPDLLQGCAVDKAAFPDGSEALGQGHIGYCS